MSNVSLTTMPQAQPAPTNTKGQAMQHEQAIEAQRLRMSFARRAKRAFTIVEVVVAIGVVLILLYIISLLFTNVSAASDLILSNYQVSGYSTALGAQLRDDVRRMNTSGVMVIRNQAYLDPATNRWTNVDQIAFLTSGETASQMYGLHWVQPQNGVDGTGTDTSDTGLKRSFTASDARVWYGHVHPIPLPIPPPPDDHAYSSTNAIGPLGAVDSRLWALGRHSALLANRYVSMNNTVATYRDKNPPDNIWFNYTTTQTGISSPNYFGGATRDLVPFVNGQVDVIADPIHATPEAIRSAILYGDIDPTTAAINPPNFSNSIYPWGQPFFPSPPGFASLNAYERIEGMAFRIYGQRKVSIDATPLSESLLQTQNIIAPFCSNFQVEFAGDYTNTAGTAIRDGYIDIGVGDNATDDPTATGTYPHPVYWYGGFDGTSRKVVKPATAASPYGNGTTDKGLNTRISPVGTINTNTDLYTAAFGYDKSVTPWPRMLRITVNLQDDKGRLRDSYLKTQLSSPTPEDTIDGKQFQFVIELPQ